MNGYTGTSPKVCAIACCSSIQYHPTHLLPWWTSIVFPQAPQPSTQRAETPKEQKKVNVNG